MSLNTGNNTNRKGFSGLSDLISDIAEDIADAYHCPKCGHINDNSEEECLQCGIVYSKYTGPVSQKRSQVAKTATTPASSPSKSNSQHTVSEDTVVADEPSSEKMTIGSIKLCADPKCVGSIGDDGKCEICGKSEDSEPPPDEPVSVCEEGACIAGVDGKCVNCGKKVENTSVPKKKEGYSLGWGIILVSALFFVFLIISGNLDSPDNSNKTGKKQSSYTPQSNSLNSKPVSKTKTSSQDKTQSSPPNELSFSVQKPPVGTNNVLTYPQIRYCLAEKIRLDAMESVVNSYSDSEINKFNSLIDDYNSRCGQYRYRSGALQSSRRKVETERWKLQEEGRKRVAIWRALSSSSSNVKKEQSVTQKQTPKPKPKPKPDQLVLDTQKKLTELGYKPGPVDGLMGRKTREAIKAFQQDVGLAVTGRVSASLLETLNNWKLRDTSTDNKPTPQKTETKSSKTYEAKEYNTISTSDRSKIVSFCKRVFSTPGDVNSCINREVDNLKRNINPDISGISSSRQSEIVSFCKRVFSTPGDINSCIQRESDNLRRNMNPNTSGIPSSDKSEIVSFCKRVFSTPGDINSCIQRESDNLRRNMNPNTSGIPSSDKSKIVSFCKRVFSTPGDINSCIQRESDNLRRNMNPNTSGISSSDKSKIVNDCNRIFSTPGDVNSCINRDAASLRRQ